MQWKYAVTALDALCTTESMLQIWGESFPHPGSLIRTTRLPEKERTDTNSSVGIILLQQIFIPECWLFSFKRSLSKASEHTLNPSSSLFLAKFYDSLS